MNHFLCIETSTRPCSVSLISNGNTVFAKEETGGPSHATLLGVFVEETISYAKNADLLPDAIVISAGPGSYTGLRIGVSLAKGLCYGMGIPLIPVQTLKLIAYTANLKQDFPANALLCPMIDARRMEVYTALYSTDLKQTEEVSARIIDESSFREYAPEKEIYIMGDGAEKCVSVLQNDHIHYIADVYPLARNMYPLIKEAIENGEVIKDPAYFEPFYLKEFVATQSKKAFF